MSLQSLYAAVLASGIGLLATVASAAVINVNLSHSGADSLNGTAWGPTVAPLSYTGSTWTDTGYPDATDLPDSTGAATTVDFQLTTYQWWADGWGGVKMLQGGYYNNNGGNNNATMTLTLSGLDDSKKYDLYIASVASPGNPMGGTITAGGTTLVSTGSANNAWIEGANFVHFANLTPSGGQITATIAPAGGGVSVINGFQVADAVPEPTSMALLGVAGLAVLRRRRSA